MKIYHQLGFREKWNFDSYFKDEIGEGFIFSPVNLSSKKINSLSSNYKETSFLDPQLYIPDRTPKSQLSTYDFLPQTLCDSGIFDSVADSSIYPEVAKKCFDFQYINNFEYLVIPFRKYYDESIYESVRKNESGYSAHFTEILKNYPNKKVLQTIIIDDTQLKKKEVSEFILSWVTGKSNIDGVYLIFEHTSSAKQIKDIDFLYNALTFIDILKENELEVICGYCNLESFLYSVACPDAITIGSYENLRKFNVERFAQNDDKGPRQPSPRLFSYSLLQWIKHGFIESIETLYEGEISDIFEKNDYNPIDFKESFNWHFGKPELYHHYFNSFSNEIKKLPLDRSERIKYVKEKIKSSLKLYDILDNEGILFTDDCDSAHLSAWYTSLVRFEKYLKEEGKI